MVQRKSAVRDIYMYLVALVVKQIFKILIIDLFRKSFCLQQLLGCFGRRRRHSLPLDIRLYAFLVKFTG